MFVSPILLLCIPVIYCEVVEKMPVVEKMMGLDTVHTGDVKSDPKRVSIDKDTIINHHMKLEKRGRTSNSSPAPEEREPDWSYTVIPKEISEYVEQFKKNMSECLKEVQENDKRTVKRLSPKMESPVHGECLIACVLKRNAVIENNKANKDNLLNLVSKFFAKDTKLMKKLEKNLDQCIEMSAHHHNECDLAAKLNECTNDLMTNNKHKIVVNYK